MHVRPANFDDISAIAEIAYAAWPVTYMFLPLGQVEYMLEELYSPHALRDQMEKMGRAFAVAEQAGIVVGFAAYSPKDGEPEIFKIHRLYVHPGAQRGGAGRALLEYAEVQAHGFSALELNVNRQNPAVEFYRRMGFHVVLEEDIPFGPYWMNDYRMQRKIPHVRAA